MVYQELKCMFFLNDLHQLRDEQPERLRQRFGEYFKAELHSKLGKTKRHDQIIGNLLFFTTE